MYWFIRLVKFTEPFSKVNRGKRVENNLNIQWHDGINCGMNQ